MFNNDDGDGVATLDTLPARAAPLEADGVAIDWDRRGNEKERMFLW